MRLIGFPESAKDPVRGLDIRPIDQRPPLVEAFDVVAIPGYDALYTAGGERIEISKRVVVPDDIPVADNARVHVERGFGRYCPPMIDIPDGCDVVAETVLYGGQSWPHYGHFITDAMARLWAVGDVDPRLPILFLDRADKVFGGQPYSKLVVDALGLKGRLFSVRGPTRFRRILLPAPAIQHAFRIYHQQADPHVAVACRLVDRDTGTFTGKRIYLSRSGLKRELRHSPEEERLERALVALGMTIVQPERLSLVEQIDLFAHSALVAGLIGSAFHTALFAHADRSPRFVILSWEKVNNRYPMIDAIKSIDPCYVDCTSIVSKNLSDRVVEVGLDVDAAIAAIEAETALLPTAT